MINIKGHISINNGSEKSFGIVFGIVFLIISLYFFSNSQIIYIYSLIISIVFFILSFFSPKTLLIPNLLWFKFGNLIGIIISPIVMFFIYFFTIIPTGLIMRFFRKDLLKLKIKKNTKSYWIKRNEEVSSMKNQF